MDQQTQPAAHFWDSKPARTIRCGYFWVTAERLPLGGGTYQRGPMFVAWEAPEKVTQPYPVVLVHGGTSQGTEWADTPDSRPGWAQRFVEAGYAVLIVDRPAHGRSPYHSEVLGPMSPPFSYDRCRQCTFQRVVARRSGCSSRPTTPRSTLSSRRTALFLPTSPYLRISTPTASPVCSTALARRSW